MVKNKSYIKINLLIIIETSTDTSYEILKETTTNTNYHTLTATSIDQPKIQIISDINLKGKFYFYY